MIRAILRLLRLLFPPINYRAYLRTPAWKARARMCKARAGWRCENCGTRGNGYTLHAHHLTYARLGHER